MSQANTSSGGHPILRNTINDLQATAMNDIVARIVNNRSKRFVIHDLGAKYKRNFRIFRDMLTGHHNWTYQPYRGNDN
jgi:hypothetical protein